MRISGLVLVFLVLGHLLIMNILDGGVQRINFGFVAGRWSSPFWQFWDLLQLWLAMLHGGNGMRTVISDYAEKPRTRFWLLTLLACRHRVHPRPGDPGDLHLRPQHRLIGEWREPCRTTPTTS